MGGGQSQESYKDGDRLRVDNPATGERILERDYNVEIKAYNVADCQRLQNEKSANEMNITKDILQVAASKSSGQRELEG